MNNESVVMTPTSEKVDSVEAKCREDTPTVVEKDDVPLSGPHLRYQNSETFSNSEFLENFAPLDDAVSVASEDTEPSRMFKQEQYGDSMDKLFPITVISRSNSRELKETPKLFPIESKRTPSSSLITKQEGTHKRYQGIRTEQRKVNTLHNCQGEDQSRMNVHENHPQTQNSIIRRVRDGVSSSPLSKMLERTSSYTIRLTEF